MRKTVSQRLGALSRQMIKIKLIDPGFITAGSISTLASLLDGIPVKAPPGLHDDLLQQDERNYFFRCVKILLAHPCPAVQMAGLKKSDDLFAAYPNEAARQFPETLTRIAARPQEVDPTAGPARAQEILDRYKDQIKIALAPPLYPEEVTGHAAPAGPMQNGPSC